MRRHLTKAAAKAMLAIAITFGAIAFNQTPARCADCSGENSQGIKRAFEVFGEQCKKQFGDPAGALARCFEPNVYNKILPIMKALGKDNRFGPGDRVFLPGETLNGTVTTGSSRVWQTAAPLNKDQLSIRASKLSPHGGLQIKVCGISENGSTKRIGTINFEESSTERNVVISGLQGRVVQIEILAAGSVANKIQYSLIAN